MLDVDVLKLSLKLLDVDVLKLSLKELDVDVLKLSLKLLNSKPREEPYQVLTSCANPRDRAFPSGTQ